MSLSVGCGLACAIYFGGCLTSLMVAIRFWLFCLVICTWVSMGLSYFPCLFMLIVVVCDLCFGLFSCCLLLLITFGFEVLPIWLCFICLRWLVCCVLLCCFAGVFLLYYFLVDFTMYFDLFVLMI